MRVHGAIETFHLAASTALVRVISLYTWKIVNSSFGARGFVLDVVGRIALSNSDLAL